jgi:uncharacterized membrane protein HdeD (DUF308 family)
MIRAIGALVIGVLLVMYPDTMGGILVQIIGLMFVLPGLFSIISYFLAHNATGIKHPFIFNLMLGIGSVLAGAALLLFPNKFVVALLYLLGIAVFLAGCMQMRSLLQLRKVTTVSSYNYYPAAFFLVVGALLLFKPDFIKDIIYTLLGVVLILFFLVELIQCIYFRKAYCSYESLFSKVNKEDIEDAEIVEETNEK